MHKTITILLALAAFKDNTYKKIYVRKLSLPVLLSGVHFTFVQLTSIQRIQP
jgi:hypothetical protein